MKGSQIANSHFVAGFLAERSSERAPIFVDQIARQADALAAPESDCANASGGIDPDQQRVGFDWRPT
jgi:hypothetical protein